MNPVKTTIAGFCICLGAFATGAAPIAPSDDASANVTAIKGAIDAAALDGKARRAGRRVDIGCYEADPPGLQLLVR